MSASAKSVFAFSVYLLILGIILVFVPNVLLRLFAIPETNEVWVRVVGMLVLILSFYYFHASRNGLRGFFIATVYGRASVIVFFAAFVIAGLAPPTLILFGVIDLAAAAWTWLALRSEDKVSTD